MEASNADYQTVAIPWSYPKGWTWSLCWLRVMPCCGWGCALATQTQSHCKFSRCRHFAQYVEFKLPPRWKWVIVRMQCPGWMVVQGFTLLVGIFLTLWRVDGWVIIWSFLVRFLVSFGCFVYFIITSFIFIHEGLCWVIQDVGINHWDICCYERHSGSNRTRCMAVM